MSGPLAAASRTTLRIRYDELSPADESPRATFLAYSPGDAEYRYTEQVGTLPRGFSGLKQGGTQSTTFPPIGNLKPGSPPARLKARSDAGLPVEYYVAFGPAMVVDGKLAIAELPTRVQFSIRVKVVAYQLGRRVEPLVQTAAPVDQTIEIDRP